MHKELDFWLSDFQRIVQSEGPTRIANSLIMLGVDVSDRCDCLADLVEYSEGEGDVLMSLHKNHLEFNTCVWNILDTNGMRQSVRRVLLHDMRRDAPKIIGNRGYGRALLDNFLLARPDRMWVDLWNMTTTVDRMIARRSCWPSV